MGPDEDKNYTDPIIMHLNPDTGEWEEVGKLRDIKEIEGDIPICKELKNIGINDFEDLKTTFKRHYGEPKEHVYAGYETKLYYNVKRCEFEYAMVGYGPFCVGTNYGHVLDRIVHKYGNVVKVINDRRRKSIIDTAALTESLIKWHRDNINHGYWWIIPEVVDVFESLEKGYIDADAKFFIIKVR